MTNRKTWVRRAVAVGALATATVALGATAAAQAAPQEAQASASVAETPTFDPAHYFIRARHTNWAIIPSSSTNNMVMRDMSGFNPYYTHQLWHFNQYSNGAYEVQSHNEGCLDTQGGGSLAVGAKVTFAQCDGTPSQRWFSVLDNGGWTLQNQWSGLYATVQGSYANAPVTQQYNSGAANQRYNMPFHSFE
jgi:hypothetical protein